ncbi:hypothetical protein OsJ_08806 [Oryza sativa Japonica Group]|uniref:Uncharacterized protein n=1 Tax=Oryza sativa subsp. japonica TaxID=39947 RepID=Q6KA88_ORYSJ|nr:hypothetical protein OsJ_08806 [Oryza sativa Japonica Group]BAD19132.1 hypothetical protein [Oryza sativa Japonica Group]BAD19247.1 hypothetical protein [Oryza sativa Japonica Group]
MMPTKCSTPVPSCGITKSDAESTPTTLEHVFLATMNPSTPSAASAAAVPPVSLTATKEDEVDMGKVEDKSDKTLHDLCVEIKEMINQMLETCRNSKVEPIVGDDSTGVAVVPCSVTNSVPIALEASQEIVADESDGNNLAREEDCVEKTTEGPGFGEHLTFCLSPKVDVPILDLIANQGMSRFIHKVDLEPWPNPGPCQGNGGMVVKISRYGPPHPRANYKDVCAKQQLEPWADLWLNHGNEGVVVKLLQPWPPPIQAEAKVEVGVLLLFGESHKISLDYRFTKFMSRTIIVSAGLLQILVPGWCIGYALHLSSTFWNSYQHMQLLAYGWSFDDHVLFLPLMLVFWPIHDTWSECLLGYTNEDHDVQKVLICDKNLRGVLIPTELKIPWPPPNLTVQKYGVLAKILLPTGLIKLKVLDNILRAQQWYCSSLGESLEDSTNGFTKLQSVELVQYKVDFASSSLLDIVVLQGDDSLPFLLPGRAVLEYQEFVTHVKMTEQSVSKGETDVPKLCVLKFSLDKFSNYSVGDTMIAVLLTQTCVQLVPSYNQSLSGSKNHYKLLMTQHMSVIANYEMIWWKSELGGGKISLCASWNFWDLCFCCKQMSTEIMAVGLSGVKVWLLFAISELWLQRKQLKLALLEEHIKVLCNSTMLFFLQATIQA